MLRNYASKDILNASEMDFIRCLRFDEDGNYQIVHIRNTKYPIMASTIDTVERKNSSSERDDKRWAIRVFRPRPA